jgi:hypothetical protein
MARYLILTALAAATLAQAQGSPPAAQQVADARAATSPRTAAPSKAATPRQLSADERAELRRQLYQYNRLQGKGS